MPCKNGHDPLPLASQPRSQGFSLIWGRGFPYRPAPTWGRSPGNEVAPPQKNIIIKIIIIMFIIIIIVIIIITINYGFYDNYDNYYC